VVCIVTIATSSLNYNWVFVTVVQNRKLQNMKRQVKYYRRPMSLSNRSRISFSLILPNPFPICDPDPKLALLVDLEMPCP
jgi:hypothetical protein